MKSTSTEELFTKIIFKFTEAQQHMSCEEVALCDFAKSESNDRRFCITKREKEKEGPHFWFFCVATG